MAQADYGEELAAHVAKLPFKINSGLARVLWKMRNRVMKGRRKRDAIIFIDGAEGSGKTVLASQVAVFFRPDRFTQEEHMAWYPKQFLDKYKQSRPFDVLVYDEAVTGLLTKKAATEDYINLMLHFNTCRSGQRFIIYVQPRFYQAEPTLAVERSRCLLHVYEYGQDGSESRFDLLNQSGKESAYFTIKGKKSGRKETRNIEGIYRAHALVPQAWFPNYWAVNEVEYERLKEKSLTAYAKAQNEHKREPVYTKMWRRRFASLCLWLKRTYKLHGTDIIEVLKEEGMSISKPELSTALTETKELRERGII